LLAVAQAAIPGGGLGTFHRSLLLSSYACAAAYEHDSVGRAVPAASGSAVSGFCVGMMCSGRMSLMLESLN
jgi:hypothetical protein